MAPVRAGPTIWFNSAVATFTNASPSSLDAIIPTETIVNLLKNTAPRVNVEYELNVIAGKLIKRLFSRTNRGRRA